VATKRFALTPNIFGSSVMKLGAYNFQTAPRSWENLYTPVLSYFSSSTLYPTPHFYSIFFLLYHPVLPTNACDVFLGWPVLNHTLELDQSDRQLLLVYSSSSHKL
jgi:hypothetical protein